MLGWRLGLGTILVAALTGLLAFDRSLGSAAPVLWLLAALSARRCAWELSALLRTRSMAPVFPLTSALCAVVVSANWLPWWISEYEEHTLALAGWQSLGLALGISCCVLLAAAAWRYRAPGNSLETLGAELIILVYAGLLISLTAQLRWVGFAWSGERSIDLGYLPLGSLIIAVKCGDSAAYFCGRAFGKRQLAPLLSPKKTQAGGAGALAGAALGAWAWLSFATPWLVPKAAPCAWYWAVLFGLVIGLLGMIGDLCESLIKRDAGVKDSAPLLKGFGGALDIVDSVIFPAPVAYLLWLWLPLTG
jgi:phosphatidate cytidylyltransferase